MDNAEEDKMATDIGDVVKQGYIRIRSRNLGVWQRRWIVLRRASSKGPCRLEKYFDEKSARSGTGHKVALLSSVMSVSRITASFRKHAFAIRFWDTMTKCLACDSDLEADTWVKLLVQESLSPHPNLATGEPDVLSPGIQKELQEQFHVYLMPTLKLDVFGECLLQVTHEHIYLWDVSNPRLKLVAWPLTALRRYGSDPRKFTFEAGRHCTTGEGMFVFHTLEGEKIYRKVHQATLAIAEAHHRMKQQTERLQDLSLDACTTRKALLRGSTPVLPSMEAGVCAHNQSHINHDDELQCDEAIGDFLSSFGEGAVIDEGITGRVAAGKTPSKCSLRSHLLQCHLNQ